MYNLISIHLVIGVFGVVFGSSAQAHGGPSIQQAQSEPRSSGWAHGTFPVAVTLV
jgi:hypothetical protein